MERLDELVARRAKLEGWMDGVAVIMNSVQPFIPGVAHAILVEMRAEVVRIDLEILDIHEAEYEALKGDILKRCVAPRMKARPLNEDEIPF